MSEERGPINMVEVGVVRSASGQYAMALRLQSGKLIHGAWCDTEAEAEQESIRVADTLAKALREDGSRVTVLPPSSTVQ